MPAPFRIPGITPAPDGFNVPLAGMQPLNEPDQKDAFNELMKYTGLDTAKVPDLREYDTVREVADRFVGWTALHDIAPDFIRYQPVPSLEGHALSTAVMSERSLKAPHHKEPGGLGKLFRRSSGGGHGGHAPHGTHHGPDTHGLPIPDKITYDEDKHLWLVSEQYHGVAPQYTKFDKNLVGVKPGVTGPGSAELFDNGDGRRSLSAPKKNASGRLLTPNEAAIIVNGQLRDLRQIKPLIREINGRDVEVKPPLPDTFTAAHILNKAARIAAEKGIDTRTF